MTRTGILYFTAAVFFWTPAFAQSQEEANIAVETAQRYIRDGLANPSAAAAMRSASLTEIESTPAFIARWGDMGGPSNQLQDIRINGVTFYDRDGSGAERQLVAVDFLAMTPEPRVICGYLMIDLEPEASEIIREEILVLPSDVLEGALPAAVRQSLSNQVGCLRQ